MIELILALSIITILLGTSVSTFLTVRTRKAVDSQTDAIIGTISAARLDAATGKNDAAFGIRLFSNRVETFEGTTYSSSAIQRTFRLETGTELALISLLNGSDVIVFSRLTGAPSTSGTFVVRGSGRTTIASTITISPAGGVTR